jgi:hypothetical protein
MLSLFLLVIILSFVISVSACAFSSCKMSKILLARRKKKQVLLVVALYSLLSGCGFYLYIRTRGIPPPAVVVELVEGMGNQLFKYASAYSLSQSLGVPLYVVIGGSGQGFLWDFLHPFPDPIDPLARNFLLDNFQVPITPHNTLNKVTYYWNILSSHHTQQYVCEDLFYKRIHPTETKFLVSQDFCHSEHYFLPHKEQVQQMFRFSETFLNTTKMNGVLEKWRRRIEGELSVGVHIRLGDYLKQNRIEQHWVTPRSYYTQAIKLFLKKFCGDGKSINFFIFTDSIEKVKTEWEGFMGEEEECKAGYEIHFVSGEGLSSVQEFWLLTLCHHAIISNSTFSWWGAYLMKNKGKMVVAPTYHPQWWEHYKDLREKAFKMSMWKYNYPHNWTILDPYS